MGGAVNPVRAGVTSDPADHQLSGHRELLGKVRDPLVDVGETLYGFADTLRRARREYLGRLGAAIENDTGVVTRLTLPWWTRDRELTPEEGRPFVDELGRGTGLERSTLDGATFVMLACRVLEVEPAVLGSGRQDRAITRLRELVRAVGIERWGQQAGELGRVLGRHPDVVSRWVRKAGQRRAEDPAVAEQHDALDRALAEAALAVEDGR